MSVMAIFQQLAQQCRYAARRSHSHGWLRDLEWNGAALGEGCSTKCSATRKSSGAFAFGGMSSTMLMIPVDECSAMLQTAIRSSVPIGKYRRPLRANTGK